MQRVEKDNRTFVVGSGFYPQSKEVTFNLHLQTHTPEDEIVCIHGDFGINGWTTVPMQKISENEWQTIIKLQLSGIYQYHYCRNYMYKGAEEDWEDREYGLRNIKNVHLISTIKDTVKKWRWWPSDGKIPEIDTSFYPDEVVDDAALLLAGVVGLSGLRARRRISTDREA